MEIDSKVFFLLAGEDEEIGMRQKLPATLDEPPATVVLELKVGVVLRALKGAGAGVGAEKGERFGARNVGVLEREVEMARDDIHMVKEGGVFWVSKEGKGE